MAIGKTNAIIGNNKKLIEKNITENGTYLARLENADGYSRVVVDVPNSGGGSGYVRPDDWLEIPDLDTTKDEIYILNGVGDFNQLIFEITSTGEVTVDWGDGYSETNTEASTTTFAHTYNYDEIDDGSYTQHNKTKQVLVHIYADRNTLKLFDMNGDYYFTNADNVRVKYSINVSTNVYEVKANVQECEVWCSSGSYLRHKNLEIFDWLGNITNTSMDYMFSSCYSLQTIPQLDTSNVTSMSSMFYYCYSLQSMPQLDTSNVTNMSYMFNYCYSLQTIPQLDTSNVTSMYYMFSNCYSLQSIPQLDTSNVTSMSSMFYYCYSLQSISQLDTSNVTSMYNMFYFCYSLQSIPQLDTSNVTNMGYMFNYCRSLQSIPQLDTSNVTGMSYMFNYCYSLQSIPQLDTSNVTDMSYMFQYCYSLQTIPQLDTSNVTNMGYMFNYCRSLQTIPQLDTSNVTSMDSIFRSCYSLQNPILYKANKSFDINNSTMMTKQQIVDLVNSISTVTETQTLTLGTTLQGYMTDVYVKAIVGEHPTYILPTSDTQPATDGDGNITKTYYTYNEIDKIYEIFGGAEFEEGIFYYEEVTSDETLYVMCEGSDSGAMTFTDWVTTAKGWTIA